MNFKLFIESISTLQDCFMMILHHRFDHGPRLIASDYLAEIGLPAISKMIEIAHTSNQYGNSKYPHKEWYSILDEAKKELAQYGLHSVNPDDNVFSDGKKIYRVAASGIQVQKEYGLDNWTVLPIQKYTDNLIIGGIFVIAADMFRSGKHTASEENPNGTSEEMKMMYSHLQSLRNAFYELSLSIRNNSTMPRTRVVRFANEVKNISDLLRHLPEDDFIIDQLKFCYNQFVELRNRIPKQLNNIFLPSLNTLKELAKE